LKRDNILKQVMIMAAIPEGVTMGSLWLWFNVSYGQGRIRGRAITPPP